MARKLGHAIAECVPCLVPISWGQEHAAVYAKDDEQRGDEIVVVRAYYELEVRPGSLIEEDVD